MVSIADMLLYETENDLRYIRTIYPSAKNKMFMLGKKLSEIIAQIIAFVSTLRKKTLKFNNYGDFSSEILDFLVNEAYSPLSAMTFGGNQDKNQYKRNFSFVFDKNLPKGPRDIKTFQTNPFDKIIRCLTPPFHLLDINLSSNIEFFDVQAIQEPLWIDNETDLSSMVEELKTQLEISIDLENHSYYSYYGYCCLMQISTRSKDYLIDSVLLRNHIKPYLGSILENQGILKIFHGGESDIYWLQRDFGLFVVSIFDSYHASAVLNLERKSLSFLIEYFFGVKMDKTHQTSDWRIRPLPKDMKNYAQLDTKCLFPLYDALRYKIYTEKGKEMLVQTFVKSSHQGLKLYKPNPYSEKIRSLGPIPATDLALAQKLMNLREETARKFDFCPHAIIPSQELYSIIITKSINSKLQEKKAADFLSAVKKIIEEELDNRYSRENNKTGLGKRPAGFSDVLVPPKANIISYSLMKQNFSNQIHCYEIKASPTIDPSLLLEEDSVISDEIQVPDKNPSQPPVGDILIHSSHKLVKISETFQKQAANDNGENADSDNVFEFPIVSKIQEIMPDRIGGSQAFRITSASGSNKNVTFPRKRGSIRSFRRKELPNRR